MAAMSLQAKARLIQAALLVVGLAAWESGIRQGWLAGIVPNPAFWFSSPSAIGNLLWRLAETGRLWSHVWLTLSATLLGLAIGAASGTLVGVALSGARRLDVVLDPIWSSLNALPKVALAPLFTASFGIGILSKSLLAVTLVFFVFLFNTVAGLRGVDPLLVNGLRLMGASRLQIFRMAMMPTLVRWHYGALRISLGLALTAVIVGEFVAARGGVGFIIQYGFGTFNVTWCYAGIVVLGTMALVIDAAMRAGQRRLSPWEAAR